MYPSDKARTGPARPIQDLAGTVHAGARLTSSAASSAIMVIFPDDQVALISSPLRCRISSVERQADRRPYTKTQIRKSLSDPDLAFNPGSWAHFKIICDHFG